jgi:isocitrate dehydrogenase (NAD+)
MSGTASMGDSPRPPAIVVLHGDQTGEELLLQALRLLERDVIGAEVTLQHYDLSLSRRRETRNQVVLEAAGALREAA